MRNLLLLIIAVVIVIAILIYSGFLNLSPEGEAAMDNARDSVGQAVEKAGETLQNTGQAAQDGN